MAGTVKMGNPEQKDTGVDKDFRVVGLEALRVVDISIAPIMTKQVELSYLLEMSGGSNRTISNHTQSVAYLIGETAAEKLIKEYSLASTNAT